MEKEIANLREIKQPAMTKRELKNLTIPLPGEKIGPITPAENQATAKLVRNSEYTLLSPKSSAINTIIAQARRRSKKTRGKKRIKSLMEGDMPAPHTTLH